MSHLCDTSILGRLAEPDSTGHIQAMEALVSLQRQGEDLCITSQNLIEFWTFATRPASVNGLELTTVDTAARIDQFHSLFLYLPDHSDIYPTWRGIVEEYAVSGKPTHDARLVAAMHVYGITHLLTFNDRHFRRYQDLITPVHPNAIRPG